MTYQADTATNASAAPRRKRRWLRYTAITAIVLAAGLGIAATIFLDANRYRPQVIRQLERYTGLHAAIGRLDLNLFPAPVLVAHNIYLGDGDFHARIPRVRVRFDAAPLLSRQVHINEIRIERAAINLPGGIEPSVDRIRTIIDRFGGSGDGGGEPLDVKLNRITLKDIGVGMAGEKGQLLVASGAIRDVLSGTIGIDLDGALPEYGDHAAADVSLTIHLAPKGGKLDAVTGTVTLAGIQTRQLPLNDAPEGLLAADLRLADAGPGNFTAELVGRLDSERHPALAGAFTALGEWRDGAFTIDDAHWQSPGVRVAASAAGTDRDGFHGTITEASITEAALDALLRIPSSERVRLDTRAGASIAAHAVAFRMYADEAFQFVDGSVTFSGIDARTDQNSVVFGDIRGDLSMRDNLIRVQEIYSDGLWLTGTVAPDFGAGSARVELQGAMQLRPAYIRALALEDTLTDLDGAITLGSLSGTFGQSKGFPDDLVLNASLDNGRLGVAGESAITTFAPITAQFTMESGALHTVATARMDNGDVLAADGQLEVAERRWNGTVAGNAEALITRLAMTEAQSRAWGPYLAPFRQITLGGSVSLPARAADRFAIEGERVGGTPLTFSAVFPGTRTGYTLGDVRLEGEITLEQIDDGLIRDVNGSGPAKLLFTHDAGEARYAFSADFAQCLVQPNEKITKRPGDRLTAGITGSTRGDWAIERAFLGVLDEEIDLRFVREALQGDIVTIELARIQGLFPEGSTVDGAVRVDFVTEPLRTSVHFDSVRLALDEDVQIDAVDGAVHIDDDAITLRDVSIRGANSDCMIQGGMENDRWTGQLTGSAFDVDAVLSLYDGVAPFFAFGGDDEGAAHRTAGAGERPFSGTFQVDLARVHYRRADVSGFVAGIDVDGSGVHARDVSFKPENGLVSGSVDVFTDRGEQNVIVADIAFENADLRLLDGLLFEESHEFSGLATGTLTFEAPAVEMRGLLANTNANLIWVAKDGSFGKLGFATKFLAVLRTTEIIRFRKPDFRDEGLTFTNCEGGIVVKDGVLEFNDTVLQTPSYAMEVTGGIDFPQDSTGITVFVRVLESVTSLAAFIPIVREIADVTTKNIGIAIVANGSPYDMTFVPRPGATAGRMVGGTVKAGGEMVRDVVTSPIKTIRRVFTPGAPVEDDQGESPPRESGADHEAETTEPPPEEEPPSATLRGERESPLPDSPSERRRSPGSGEVTP